MYVFLRVMLLQKEQRQQKRGGSRGLRISTSNFVNVLIDLEEPKVSKNTESSNSSQHDVYDLNSCFFDWVQRQHQRQSLSWWTLTNWAFQILKVTCRYKTLCTFQDYWWWYWLLLLRNLKYSFCYSFFCLQKYRVTCDVTISPKGNLQI